MVRECIVMSIVVSPNQYVAASCFITIILYTDFRIQTAVLLPCAIYNTVYDIIVLLVYTFLGRII